MFEPNIKELFFLLSMLSTPFIGLLLGGGIGFVIGLGIGGIGMIWFFVGYGGMRKLAVMENLTFGKSMLAMTRLRCEICDRQISRVERGMPAYVNSPGVLIDQEAMRAGLEGPGYVCKRCGRIYCYNCMHAEMPSRVCRCGSTDFQMVRLRYR